MAITGAAAIVGAVAAGSGYVAVSTVLMVGLAVSAVGMITKNQTLMKIGGGLGMGAGGVGAAQGIAAGGAGAAESSAAAAGQTAPSAVAPGVQAAGDLGENVVVGGAMDATTGVTATPLAESAASGATGAAGSEGVSLGTNAMGDATQAVNSAANPAATSINSAINGASPAAANIGGSSAAQAADTGGFGGAASGSSASGGSDTIASNVAQQSSVAPGPQAAAPVAPAAPTTQGATAPVAPTDGGAPVPNSGMPAPGSAASGTTGTGAPLGFNNPMGVPAGNAVTQDPAGWWTSMQKWFTDLDSHGKLAVGQSVSGLVSGVGKGVASYISEDQKLALEKQKYADQVRNANSIPTVGMTVNPNYKSPGLGLVNSAKKA